MNKKLIIESINQQVYSKFIENIKKNLLNKQFHIQEEDEYNIYFIIKDLSFRTEKDRLYIKSEIFIGSQSGMYEDMIENQEGDVDDEIYNGIEDYNEDDEDGHIEYTREEISVHNYVNDNGIAYLWTIMEGFIKENIKSLEPYYNLNPHINFEFLTFDIE